jgi:hypothetical protein
LELEISCDEEKLTAEEGLLEATKANKAVAATFRKQCCWSFASLGITANNIDKNILLMTMESEYGKRKRPWMLDDEQVTVTDQF